MARDPEQLTEVERLTERVEGLRAQRATAAARDPFLVLAIDAQLREVEVELARLHHRDH
jgi:type II secretory pathway component PulM